ncbi:hypothetical protein CGGC5_v017026 [Colletotrichum fructicola Nara gc5]|uniref:Uncharacterized protein n=1 Tax=Colletotrichum fructicola (strain Nara gc5) TaxID=1213859 RepID=A0A7J6IC12_COLFN|nr:hypothetical protein CGGC5_v017026 [Colletotrichum fructicola Nara gc5]
MTGSWQLYCHKSNRNDLIRIAEGFLADSGEDFWPAMARKGIKFKHEHLISLLMQLFWRMSENSGRSDKSAIKSSRKILDSSRAATASNSQTLSAFTVPGVIAATASITDIYARLGYGDEPDKEILRRMIRSHIDTQLLDASKLTRWKENQGDLLALAQGFLAEHGDECWPADAQAGSKLTQEE